jgi:chromosome segregation ATPase
MDHGLAVQMLATEQGKFDAACRELKETRAEMGATRAELMAANSRLQDALDELESARAEIERLRDELNTARRDVVHYENQLGYAELLD